jgi:hypothetical protein
MNATVAMPRMLAETTMMNAILIPLPAALRYASKVEAQEGLSHYRMRSTNEISIIRQ